MIKINLGGSWSMRRADSEKAVPAQVPGSICTDLIRAGLLPENPYFGMNTNLFEQAAEFDYIYSRSFTADAAVLGYENITLNCEGLDTLCEIYINGGLLAKTDNMHRTWRFNIKNYIREGENKLEILIKSPTRFCRDADKKRHLASNPPEICRAGFPHLRKAHCMLGWDWGPILPDGGIWRDIYIGLDNGVRLLGVRTSQEHKPDGSVILRIAPELAGNGENAEYTVKFDGEEYEFSGESSEIPVKNPKLWYPSGYGEQQLYDLTVAARTDRDSDEISLRVGLRRAELVMEKDKFGRSMYFRVNGIPVFAKGANYVIEDSLITNYSQEKTRRLLLEAKKANQNIIRVWGGAIYPFDYFYDICDELGLMVWQDFMFACAQYPDDEAFYENIAAEAADNVRRLRNHASLVMWCGNNECETALKDWWNLPQEDLDAYLHQYNEVLPKALFAGDDRPYVPSSPTSYGDFEDIGGESVGDAHYWDVWFKQANITEYLNYHFRFLSEFGFQSFPSIETIREYTAEEDRNIFSRVMEHHQRDGAANGKILAYMSREFKYPKDLDSLAYVSQIMQSVAVGAGVEHMRRNRNENRCMGAIYWQLNDCWPVASWSGIDYFGRWKMLHYSARKFYADVLISAYHDAKNGKFCVTVVNDTTAPVKKKVYFAVKNTDGKILAAKEKEIEAAPLSAVDVFCEDTAEIDIYNEYVEFGGDGETCGAVLLCQNKHFNYKNPGLSYETRVADGKTYVTVRAKIFANFVELKAANNTAVFDDNYFALSANGEKTVSFDGTSEDIKVRSLYDSF